MGKLKSFQTILLFIFSAFILIAVLIFSGIIPVGKSNNSDILPPVDVVMWGTMPNEVFLSINEGITNFGESYTITYVEKSEEDFSLELINAIASGIGPDMILASHPLLLSQEDKLAPINFLYLPERTYIDSFADSTRLFMRSRDVIALPLYIDPLVMYWNKDLHASARLVSPPATWVDVNTWPEKLTKRDRAGNISQAAVAMGSANNISNFKEILSTLILQTGNKIVVRNTQDSAGNEPFERATAVLAGGTLAQAALQFYVDFANPAQFKYSWNTALGESIDEFALSRLAVYFGKASELADIRNKNPHLNFDVSIMPQNSSPGSIPGTYADIYGIGVLKSSPVVNGAIGVASSLAFGNMAEVVHDATGLAPARRDLLSQGSEDIYRDVFYESGIISRSWLDPDPTRTRDVFADMINNASVGIAGVGEAVSKAQRLIQAMF